MEPQNAGLGLLPREIHRPHQQLVLNFLQYDKLGLARSVSRALFQIIGGGIGLVVAVEGACGSDLDVSSANLLAALLETRADVLDALGELGQRRQDVVLGNL